MSKIFRRSGGYRKLYSFNFATIVHLGAIAFCKRFIPWQEDTLGARPFLGLLRLPGLHGNS